MAVNRCVCHDVTFKRLVEMARDEGLTLEQLSERTGCGTGCGTCVPYIRIALRTGQVDLPVLNAAALRDMASEPETELYSRG